MNLLEPCTLSCPYCGENIEILVDLSAGDQQYVEDCPVCCKPMNLAITIDNDRFPQITARSDDE